MKHLYILFLIIYPSLAKSSDNDTGKVSINRKYMLIPMNQEINTCGFSFYKLFENNKEYSCIPIAIKEENVYQFPNEHPNDIKIPDCRMLESLSPSYSVELFYDKYQLFKPLFMLSDLYTELDSITSYYSSGAELERNDIMFQHFTLKTEYIVLGLHIKYKDLILWSDTISLNNSSDLNVQKENLKAQMETFIVYGSKDLISFFISGYYDYDYFYYTDIYDEYGINVRGTVLKYIESIH
jgi:hypothetical protein